MLQPKSVFIVAGLAAMTLAGTITGAEAKKSCVLKAAEGNGTDEKAAKFQVDEALLQAVD